MTGLKLYEALDALQIADSWLEEAGGELTPEVEAALEQAEGDFATKAERVALKVRQLEAEAEAIERESDRLAARAKARLTGAASLKSYLARTLEAAGKDSVRGLLVTVAFQRNAPSVIGNLSQSQLAELIRAGASHFVRVVPEYYELDKSAVKAKHAEAVGDGKEPSSVLPAGVEVVQTRSLRIR